MAVSIQLDGGLTELFAPAPGEFYNYAPCVVQTDENTKYVFYCTNKDSGIIVDYIGWRKGTRTDQGWIWSEETHALGPGDTGWDCIHVCDPDVLKGEFLYEGHVYGWALFYLGCDRLDCNHNQIGMAFADSIEGPWVKFSGNPVVSGAELYWGTGQCSEVSLDRKGKFKLIYRDADAAGHYYKAADCDFSDMSSYLVGEPVTLGQNGMPAVDLCMSHVAYDPIRNLYYMMAEKDWDGTVRCCRELVVSAVAAEALDGTVPSEWTTLAVLTEQITGKYGNHNPAIGRDPYGYIVNPDELDMFISSGEQTYIWSFRICEITGKLQG
ncbi:hypothetical protein [Paenibacillus gansuensis]|uniref:Uncharacterized protein n=1 Tax=Paenibacillus gansuensis TaxID=306542 RepID=A0ABW5PHR9_9BACL